MTTTFKKVLVAIKPGQPGLPLSAHHARVLAGELGARLRLVSCVFETQVAAGVLTEDLQAFVAQTGLLEAERERLEALGRSLADWGGAVDTSVRWGHSMRDVILAEAREWPADLLVIGAHGHEPKPRPRLRDIDWRLMEGSPCPLLVVKSPRFAGYARILACVDPLHRHAEPSGLDESVLEIASGLARALDSELSIVHAYPPPEAFELASAIEVSPGVLYGSENIEDVHRRAVLALMENRGLSSAQVRLEPGSPEEVILNEARRVRADLVVIGAIKRGWLEHVLLGRTAEKVAAEVDSDLLLVGGGRWVRAQA